MQEPNTYCSICGKPYHLCLSCDKGKNNLWKVYTDTSEHYKVFQIIRGYSLKVLSLEEARKKINNVNISDMNGYKPEIKQTLTEILNSDNKSLKKSASNEDKAKEKKNNRGVKESKE